MKSVLLYANPDHGLEARLQAALDVVRHFSGHLTLLQVTPFDSFIMSDPFGGIYALPSVVEHVTAAESDHRRSLEGRLAHEGVAWDWLGYEGTPAQLIVDRSRLSDLIVLSLSGERDDGPLSIVADVALHARAPLLAVPQGTRRFDPAGNALIAWNGAAEAAHSLRSSLPMLRAAAGVEIVTITDDRTGFPAVDACEYLARHGISAQLHEWPRQERPVADALRDAARVLRAAYIVMGAYGHSRMREAVLGGVTRDLLDDSPLPLLLGH